MLEEPTRTCRRASEPLEVDEVLCSDRVSVSSEGSVGMANACGWSCFSVRGS